LYTGLHFICLGWFLVWGAVYGLYFVPVFVLFNVLQAFFEERYVLGKEFGDEHKAYKKRVGMFIPKLGRILTRTPSVGKEPEDQPAE
jgi:protein-S-isoprenylcysteine O-methyltransferase Ste14